MTVHPDVSAIVDAEWCARFGLDLPALHAGGTHVVAADIGMNDAMSFRLDDTCIVVVRDDGFAGTVAKAQALVAGLDADAAFTADALRSLVGRDATVDGPSWHSYVVAPTFRRVEGSSDVTVERMAGDDARLLRFLRRNDIADWAESGFPLEPATSDPTTTWFYGLFEGGELQAAGNMTEWRGIPADVGVLTAREARGRGFASVVASAMVDDALPSAGVVRYRALATNRASLRVARRLGFEPYGQNYRARRLAGDAHDG